MTAPDSLPLHALAEENLAAASPDLLRAMVKTFADALMSAEADALCNAEYGQVSDERVNHRNGYRPREWDTRAGTAELAVPKLLQGSYFPHWLLERRRRAEQALISVVATAYLLGVSTRRVEKLAESLGVTQLLKSQVSAMAKHLDEQVAAFRNRPLDAGAYSFVWVDALTQKVQEGGRIVSVHALIAVGVNADGHREILGIGVATAEDGAGWLAFLRSLIARGLSGVQLVISDAHAGLVDAIEAVLPGASWQRCRTHWSCAELTWWIPLLGNGGHEGAGSSVFPRGWFEVKSVFLQERAHVEESVADGAAAHLEQLGQDLAGADAAVEEHGGQHALRVADLLREDAAAGAWLARAASLLMTAPFHSGGLPKREAVNECGEIGATHACQGRVGQGLGQRFAAAGCQLPSAQEGQ